MPRQGSFCLDEGRDVLFYCDYNFMFKSDDGDFYCYKMNGDQCYHQDMGWFDCYEFGCYNMADEWSCD